MCLFVTAVLPKDAPLQQLREIARTHNRRLEPLGNASVESALKQDERYYVTTLGHCDCGTVLGALRRGDASRSRRPRDEAEKMKKKGWSAAKIARALEQKREHQQMEENRLHSAVADETSTWLSFIVDVLGRVPYLGLLIHHYSGPLSERIVLEGRATVKATDLTPTLLGNLREDVLYEFRRQA